MIKLKVENGYVGKDVGVERIRRITGYLVGTMDRFNGAKKAEVQDRVKHGTENEENIMTMDKAA